MNLTEFPPLCPPDQMILQQSGGQLIFGTENDRIILKQSQLLSSYPVVEKARLLQHSLSREDVRNVFAYKSTDRMTRVCDLWTQEGWKGVVYFLATLTDGTRYWPMASLCRSIIHWQRRLSSLLSFLLPSVESNVDLLSGHSLILDWPSNWLRSAVFHPDGHRLAVCYRNDCIRVFAIGMDARPTLTLRHRRQNKVADMAWKYAIQGRPSVMSFAVACDSLVLLWRIDPNSLTSRPASQCVQVLTMPCGFAPVIQIAWKKFDCSLLIVSPSSKRILIWNAATDGQFESISAWSFSTVTRITVSQNVEKILVHYNSNMIRVYDLHSLCSEKWTYLNGPCQSAVFSPDSRHFLFTTVNSCQLLTVSFGHNSMVDKSNLGGSSRTAVVFDFSPISRNDRTIGGQLQQICLSPDGFRMAVSFREHSHTVALLSVDWEPNIRLNPCGLISLPDLNRVELLLFQPVFQQGSLLCVAWSDGELQYIPLQYSSTSPNQSFQGELSSISRRNHTLFSTPLQDLSIVFANKR